MYALRKGPKAGFTLIELLVVIAILGIFTSIVLAFLGSARNEAKDAKIRGQMASMKQQAELYSRSGTITAVPGSSSGCNPTSLSNTLFETGNNGLGNLINSLGVSLSGASNTYCISDSTLPSSGGLWAFAAALNEGGVWCVDSSGASRSKNSSGVSYTSTYSSGVGVVPAITGINCN